MADNWKIEGKISDYKMKIPSFFGFDFTVE